MKQIYLKLIGSAAAIFFLSAIFCCSLCGTAQAKTCHLGMSDTAGPTLTSIKGMHQNPCCPMNGNCSDHHLFNVILPVKPELLPHANVSQFTKAFILFEKYDAKSYLAFPTKVSFESPPLSFQQSVPIYLLDRVLRL